MPRVRRSKYANDAKDTAQLASSLAQSTTKLNKTVYNGDFYLSDYGGVADALYTDGNGIYFSDVAKTIPATDNSNAIATAIAAIPKGAKLHVRGAYYFSKEITINKKMWLLADGNGNDDGSTIFYVKDITTKNGLVIKSAQVRVTDLYVKCFDTTAGVAIYSLGESGIGRYNAYIQIEKCWAIGANMGFYIGDTYMSEFNFCTASNNVTGFKLSNASTTISFKNCWALSNTGHGYSLLNMFYSTFANCGADGNGGIGYYADTLKGVNFINCGAESNQKVAFKAVNSHVNLDGFVSVGNGITDAESTFLYAQNSKVGFINCHEESQPANSTLLSIINNDSNIDLNMSVLIKSFYSTANAKVFGKVFIGADGVVEYFGKRRKYSGTPSTNQITATVGDVLVNPSYHSNTSPISEWVCITGGAVGVQDWRPQKFNIINCNTAGRPTASGFSSQGLMCYDTTISKLIRWDGTTWRDATGVAV
jgi:hypothetical protein